MLDAFGFCEVLDYRLEIVGFVDSEGYVVAAAESASCEIEETDV